MPTTIISKRQQHTARKLAKLRTTSELHATFVRGENGRLVQVGVAVKNTATGIERKL